MSEFNQRWQIATEHARRAPRAEEATAPFGFAARIVASASNRRTAPFAWEALWERFTLRAALCAGVVLLGCVVLEHYGPTADESFLPEIEPAAVTLPWTS